MLRTVLALIALQAALQSVAAAQRPPPPPPRLPAVPVPAGNPITPDKAVLGKILFWEEQLSSNNRVSCGSCHRPENAGADPAFARHPGFNGTFDDQDDVFGSFGVRRNDPLLHYKADASFGFDTQVTRRSSPNIFAAMFAPRLFWDGRAGGRFRDPITNQVVLQGGAALETQSVGPPVSDVEMAHEQRDWTAISTKLQTAKPMQLATNLTPDMQTALNRDATYPALFTRAFGSPGVTPARIAMAIATYERTLVPDQTPYDAFANGNPQALTQAQHNGFRAFNGPGRCNVCHTAPIGTSGTGAGNGHATIVLPLPNLPALANQTFYVQWFVVDPAAIGGVAVSQAATIRTF